MDTEKKIIHEQVFHKISYKEPIKFKEIDIDLEPDDEILQDFEDEYHGSDHAHDAHWSMTIFRDRLETDEEFEKRMEELERMRGELKERRRQQYIKLKKEFENE
jgi:hypothetical protein